MKRIKTWVGLSLVGMALGAWTNVTPITWQDLADVKFAPKLNKEIGEYFLYPTFGKKVLALDNKVVEIKGYMIPLSAEENVLVISSKPMAACFFCGGSGPESVVQVKLKKPVKFKTDQIATIRGQLKLNPDNIEELNYILLNAEPVPGN